MRPDDQTAQSVPTVYFSVCVSCMHRHVITTAAAAATASKLNQQTEPANRPNRTHGKWESHRRGNTYVQGNAFEQEASEELAVHTRTTFANNRDAAKKPRVVKPARQPRIQEMGLTMV